MNMISWVRIKTSADGLFEFDAEGDPAVITRAHDRNGEVVDHVAWRLDQPQNWWLRHGDETPILGAHNLAMAAHYGDPIIVYPTPQDWLLAGHKGIVVIKWSWPIAELVVDVPEIVCANPELEQRLVAVLRRWEPRIVVRQGMRNVA